VLIPLLAATLALLVAAIALPKAVAMSPLFWTHLVVAVAIMTLITAAMQHFVPVLTRSRGAGRSMARLPGLMLAAGLLAVMVFAGWLDYGLISVAAGLGLIGAVAMLVWMRFKGRAALGRPHPGLDWYLAAMGCLALGLSAAALIPWLPQWHEPLRAFHIHINLYGFIGLTAIGTLQVLMPTVAGQSDPEAAARLRLDLKWALAGSLLLALGEAGVPYVIWPGLAAWGWPLFNMMRAWWHLHRSRLFALHGSEPVLFVALLGFVLALIGTQLNLEYPLTVFLPGFLFPLVSGAAGQLAPVWARPGVATPWHGESRRFLGRYAGIRAILFLASALLPVLGYKCSGMPGLTALFWFLILFAVWLWRD
jgi:hypothetical protein